MSAKEKSPSIWFKTARQVHQYLTCPNGEDFMWGKGESAVKDGIVYEVAEKTVYNHVDDSEGKEKLKRNRKRCFAKRTVDIYAKTHLSKVVDDADPAEMDEPEMSESQTGAALRVAADARVKSATAKLKELELKRELGQTVPTATVERENGERAQAIKLHLSSFMRDFAPELLSHVGGDIKVAQEIIEIVGGDPDKAEQLSGFIYSRRPLLLDAFRRRLIEALNVYARGEWFTDEMREAWEKMQESRKDDEAEVAVKVLDLVGGDPVKLGVLIEGYEINVRDRI